MGEELESMENFRPDVDYICIAKDGVYNIKTNYKEALVVKDRATEDHDFGHILPGCGY